MAHTALSIMWDDVLTDGVDCEAVMAQTRAQMESRAVLRPQNDLWSMRSMAK